MATNIRKGIIDKDNNFVQFEPPAPTATTLGGISNDELEKLNTANTVIGDTRKIKSIGDGTLSGAISYVNSNITQSITTASNAHNTAVDAQLDVLRIEKKLGSTDNLSGLGDGTVAGAISSVNSKASMYVDGNWVLRDNGKYIEGWFYKTEQLTNVNSSPDWWGGNAYRYSMEVGLPSSIGNVKIIHHSGWMNIGNGFTFAPIWIPDGVTRLEGISYYVSGKQQCTSYLYVLFEKI